MVYFFFLICSDWFRYSVYTVLVIALDIQTVYTILVIGLDIQTIYTILVIGLEMQTVNAILVRMVKWGGRILSTPAF